MSMIKILTVVTSLIFLAHEPSSKNGVIDSPPQWGSVSAAGLHKPDIQAILGPGVFRDTIGDCGASYYTDPTHSVTVSIFYFTDCLVGQFEVRSGLYPPPHMNASEEKTFVSDSIAATRGFGYSGQIHFGDNTRRVTNQLGSPRTTFKDRDMQFWTYQCSDDTSNAISFGFLNGVLKSVRFFGGDSW